MRPIPSTTSPNCRNTPRSWRRTRRCGCPGTTARHSRKPPPTKIPHRPPPGVECSLPGRKRSSSARPERQSKMGEKRVSRTAKLRKVFGHPPYRAKTPFRAGLYARVSTQDQQTIPMQTRALREYAVRRGWTIASQVKEVGSGASQRQQREKLLDAARRRDIDVVLVWRLDRWGRSVTDLLATLQELEHLGVGFVSLNEALDLTTPSGRAMAALLAVFAAFEREILQERVRAGLAHARQNGQRLGRPLTAALHADQARKLQRAGISKSEIARRLQIGRTSVRRILA